MPGPCPLTGPPGDILLAAEFPWGGSGSLLQEPKSFFFLTFYPTHIHLNFKPPPRSWYLTERGRAGTPSPVPSKGVRVQNEGYEPESSPCATERNQKCHLHHASNPANAPLSVFSREGEDFSPLHLLSSQFTCSGLTLPRHRVTRIYF